MQIFAAIARSTAQSSRGEGPSWPPPPSLTSLQNSPVFLGLNYSWGKAPASYWYQVSNRPTQPSLASPKWSIIIKQSHTWPHIVNSKWSSTLKFNSGSNLAVCSLGTSRSLSFSPRCLLLLIVYVQLSSQTQNPLAVNASFWNTSVLKGVCTIFSVICTQSCVTYLMQEGYQWKEDELLFTYMSHAYIQINWL